MALSPSMPSSSSSNLFTLARSKLHLSASSKENHSLHRWVLLKNSISRSATSTAAPPVVYPPHEDDGDDEEDEEEEADSFMFPDAGKLTGDDSKGQDENASEAKWLDSLLQALGDDDEDASAVPVDDDEDQLSPLASPMSSSDDLVNQAYPFPVPYPPFHPPLIRQYELDSICSPLEPMPYDDPLPNHYIDDDVEDLSVPDAIEDTSDDESDATTTPSSLIDSSSLSPESRQQRRRQPHVYIEDPHRYPFELDPLPFSDHFESYDDSLCGGC